MCVLLLLLVLVLVIVLVLSLFLFFLALVHVRGVGDVWCGGCVVVVWWCVVCGVWKRWWCGDCSGGGWVGVGRLVVGGWWLVVGGWWLVVVVGGSGSGCGCGCGCGWLVGWLFLFFCYLLDT